MSTKFFARPSSGYTGEAGLVNRTKYNDDSTASPRRPISSTKIDGDFNYLIDAVNALYDTAVSGVVADNSITDAKLRDSTGLSVIGRSANSSGNPADIVAANNDEVLRRSGTSIGFGQIATAGITDSAVTTAKITDTNVTFAKIQNVNTSTVLGRSSSGAGSVEALTLGSGLSLTSGILDTVRTRTQVVLTSGTSWNVPTGVNQVRYRMIAGGGGGGGVTAANTLGASGGGAGEYAEGYLTVTPSGTVSYSIGSAGAGGTAGANNGSAGGNTTLSTITVNGGSGGQGTNTFGATSAPGLGGTGGTGGDVRVAGAPGQPGQGSSGSAFWGGGGGSSQLGGGGRARMGVADGQGSGFNAVGYGAGGGGGFSTGTAQAGGNGTQGVIILEY
jgi:hypothetical protein